MTRRQQRRSRRQYNRARRRWKREGNGSAPTWREAMRDHPHVARLWAREWGR